MLLPSHFIGHLAEEADRRTGGQAGSIPVDTPADSAPDTLPAGPPARLPASDTPVFDLDQIERRAIDRALVATGGNRTRAAKLLGISERTLRNKLNTPKAATPKS